MSKITYIFPSRERRDKFIYRCYDILTLSNSTNFEIIAVLDEDDKTMKTPYSLGWMESHGIRAYYGKSEGKIHACNRELDKISADTEIVCLMSDDFKMLVKGFDDHIRRAFQDGFKGLVHFPDGRVKYIPQKTHACQFTEWMNNFWTKKPKTGKWDYTLQPGVVDKTTEEAYDVYRKQLKMQLVTFPIMHISYLKRFGYIYHPDYKSVMADEEQTQVAKDLGLYKFVDIDIMEHQHYRHGFGEPDELYKKNDSGEMYKHDKIVFQERAAKNFDL